MKKTVILYIVFCAYLQIGCKKFVQTGPPETSLTEEQVFEKDVTANGAVLGIYQGISSSYAFTQGSEGISLLTGTSGDELRSYSTSINRQQIYQNAILPTNTIIAASWTAAYDFVYRANVVIKGATASTTLSEKFRDELTGEAKFLRAWLYFHLVNFYGDVPLIVGTDYEVNRLAPRASQQAVYSQIIADLNDARTLLPIGYRDANNGNGSVRIRANKGAASALLARVYLYQGNYAKAQEFSTEVIDNQELYKMVPLADVFLPDSEETIWELGSTGYSFTQEADNYILITAPATFGGGGQKSNAISESLLEAFEAGDARFTNWVGKVTASGNDYYFPSKYKSGNGGASIPENLKVLRLAEQYLIRAEARAMLNELTGSHSANNDLNSIRRRAGLLDLPEQTLSETMLAIEQERRIEMFAEGGHRWFDLKRRTAVQDPKKTRLDEVMSIETTKKGGVWNSDKALFPIPQTERLKNPNLSQNTGYTN